MLMKRIATLWNSRELRFLLVGAFNTLMSMLIFTALAVVLEASLDKYAIVTLASAISILVNFTTQRLLVWRSRGDLVTEFAKYLISSLVVYLINISVFWVMHEWAGLAFIPAQYAAILLATVATYFILKYFAFAKRGESS
jgi:putative flippase GtrA